jgi:hypothetical protein
MKALTSNSGRFPLLQVRGLFLAGMLASLGLSTSSGWAASGVKKEPAKAKTQQKAASDEKTAITGSYIPRKVEKGRIPTTASPVVVITQDDIRRSGRVTVAGVLSQRVGR